MASSFLYMVASISCICNVFHKLIKSELWRNLYDTKPFITNKNKINL